MRTAQVAGGGNDVIPERRKFSWKPVCRTLQHHSRLHWDSSATERASRSFVCSDTLAGNCRNKPGNPENIRGCMANKKLAFKP